jgi:hypothetical protein
VRNRSSWNNAGSIARFRREGGTGKLLDVAAGEGWTLPQATGEGDR